MWTSGEQSVVAKARGGGRWVVVCRRRGSARVEGAARGGPGGY